MVKIGLKNCGIKRIVTRRGIFTVSLWFTFADSLFDFHHSAKALHTFKFQN